MPGRHGKREYKSASTTGSKRKKKKAAHMGPPAPKAKYGYGRGKKKSGGKMGPPKPSSHSSAVSKGRARAAARRKKKP